MIATKQLIYMDLEKFKGEHDNMIKEMGGYAAVMRRLTIQKIFFTLNLRAIILSQFKTGA